MMSEKKVKSNLIKCIPFVVVTLVFLAVLWIGTVYDYQIDEHIAALSDKKYYSDNLFGRIFEIFGEDPLYIFLAIALGFIFKAIPEFFEKRFTKFNKKPVVITLRTVCILLATFAYFYCVKRVFKYVCAISGNDLYTEKKLFVYAVSVVAGMILCAVTILLTDKVNAQTAQKLSVWAFVVILAAMLSQFIVHIVLKPAVGRMRFRAIYVLNENGLSDLAAYTKWYVFNGKGILSEEMISLGLAEEIFKSFPSGHVSAGSIVVTLAFLPEFLGLDKNKAKKWTIILWVISGAYIVILAYSRMVMGAHYLTDVAVGAYITYAVSIISRKIVKILVKKFKLL